MRISNGNSPTKVVDKPNTTSPAAPVIKDAKNKVDPNKPDIRDRRVNLRLNADKDNIDYSLELKGHYIRVYEAKDNKLLITAWSPYELINEQYLFQKRNDVIDISHGELTATAYRGDNSKSWFNLKEEKILEVKGFVVVDQSPLAQKMLGIDNSYSR